MRGRPREKPRPEQPANRLKEFRALTGLSQEELAAIVGVSGNTIGNWERGDRQIPFDKAPDVATALRERGVNCAPSDLMPGIGGLSIPLVWNVASAFTEDAPDRFEVAHPQPLIPPLPGLADPRDCFAARVVDDSADLLYRPGDLLIARETRTFGGVLPLGVKLLVRRRDGDDRTLEVLVGLLDRSLVGDVLLTLRTRNHELPPSVVIQRARRRFDGVAERYLEMIPKSPAVDYKPEPDDPAEILGVVVRAIVQQ